MIFDRIFKCDTVYREMCFDEYSSTPDPSKNEIIFQKNQIIFNLKKSNSQKDKTINLLNKKIEDLKKEIHDNKIFIL